MTKKVVPSDLSNPKKRALRKLARSSGWPSAPDLAEAPRTLNALVGLGLAHQASLGGRDGYRVTPVGYSLAIKIEG